MRLERWKWKIISPHQAVYLHSCYKRPLLSFPFRRTISTMPAEAPVRKQAPEEIQGTFKFIGTFAIGTFLATRRISDYIQTSAVCAKLTLPEGC